MPTSGRSSYQHHSKRIEDLKKKLVRIGFALERSKQNVYKIIPADKHMPVYCTHLTDSAYHPIRRYMRRVHNIDM